MKYTHLGNTGLIVSKLSFGSMTFGSDPSMTSIYKVSRDDAEKMVSSAIDAGINFFDTADGYSGGQSEIMLGKILAPRRKEVIISTKVGFRTGEPITQAGLSKKHILFSCEQSLRRLEDKGWTSFCNGQMNYTLVGRDVEYDIIPFLTHAGIGMTVWSPLASGFLSGKYTRENLKDPEHRLSGFDLLPFDKEFGFKVVETMKDIAAAHQASVAQIALAWLLNKKIVSSIVVGASKIHQLEDNLKAIDVELTKAELQQLDELTKPPAIYPHWFNQQLIDQKQNAID